MSLLSTLQSTSNALNVFSRALGADQANIANASTPGYAAQRATILPIDLAVTGASEADFIVFSSNGDSRVDAAVRASSSQASASQSQTEQLEPVNQLFDITGSTGILAAFQQFGAAFSKLSITPNDATLAAGALTAAGGVASAFRRVAAGLDSQKVQIDASIQSTTSQINELAASIGRLNIHANAQN